MLIKAEIEFICPGCGNGILIPEDFTLDISQTTEVDCPHCGFVLYMVLQAQLLDLVAIRSNAGELLRLKTTEAEIFTAISEQKEEGEQPG